MSSYRWTVSHWYILGILFFLVFLLDLSAVWANIFFFITCDWVQSANELMNDFAQSVQNRQVINWFFRMELYFCTNIVCSHKIADKLVVTSAVVLFFIVMNSVKYKDSFCLWLSSVHRVIIVKVFYCVGELKEMK